MRCGWPWDAISSYEGIWKINHSDFLHEGAWKVEGERGDEFPFSARPFLAQAKGPMAHFFYAMVPDIDARERLRIVTDVDGKRSIPADPITAQWDRMRQDFVDHYRPADSSDPEAEAAHQWLDAEAQRTYDDFCKKLRNYLAENLDEIAGYFGSLDRFEKDKERHQDAPFQQQRRWDRMMELRGQADKWIKDIEGQERAYANTLYGLLDKEQRKLGLPQASWNPLAVGPHGADQRGRDFRADRHRAVPDARFCTPLAALGGAAFMCFVVMTQPAFPGIYPPDPNVVGHALLVNKDFVEMVALLVVAATRAGRWGGLDFFLVHWFSARKAKKENCRCLTTSPQWIPKQKTRSAATNTFTRRDFVVGTLAAGAVIGGGLGGFYFGYDKAIGSPLRVGVIGTGDEGSVLLGAINPEFIEVKAIADIRPYNVWRAFHGDHYSEAAIKARPGLMTKYHWRPSTKPAGTSRSMGPTRN